MSSGPATPITPTASSKVEARSAKGDGVNVNITGDKTRDRCLEILYDALSADSGARKYSIPPVCVLYLTSGRYSH